MFARPCAGRPVGPALDRHAWALGVTVVDPLAPTWAEVDLAAVRDNVATLCRLADGAELMAVVKADGYGHGALPVAQAALAAGAKRLGVARVTEGLALRAGGVTAPILVLSIALPAEIPKAVRADLTLTPHNVETLATAAAAARARGRPAPVHIKVDTGMGRFGLSPPDAMRIAAQAAADPNIELEGLYSHLAAADEPDCAVSRAQFARFRRFAQAVDPHHQLVWHVCNTAALLRFPEMHLGMVRPGIGIYGLSPAPGLTAGVDLRPAMALKSVIARVFRLETGDTVGYGGAFTAPAPMRVATVPCGYGDGLPRLLSNRGAALVRGCPCPVVGRVSMDHCTLDVSQAGPVAEGDEVVFFGRQGDATIHVGDVAALAETIHYEVVSGILARVPRRYRS